MKKVGDLMKEMGFREDASDGAKEAFIKHLIKAVAGTDIETPTEKRRRLAKEWTKEKTKSVDTEPQQLSFQIEPSSNSKKVG
jgi:hypothetical protein